MREVWDNLGFDSSRVTFETKSGNTYENAVFSYEMIQPNKTDRWVLVTSAVHMPRAVGLFRQAGWNVLPYPVDYHTSGTFQWSFNLSLQYGFLAWRVISRELAGLTLNYWTGKSDAWIPGEVYNENNFGFSHS